jgi:hypothetical protein
VTRLSAAIASQRRRPIRRGPGDLVAPEPASRQAALRSAQPSGSGDVVRLGQAPGWCSTPKPAVHATWPLAFRGYLANPSAAPSVAGESAGTALGSQNDQVLERPKRAAVRGRGRRREQARSVWSRLVRAEHPARSGSPLGAPVSPGGPKPVGAPSRVTAESDRTSPSSRPPNVVPFLLRRIWCCLFTVSGGGWLLRRGLRGAVWSGPGPCRDPGSCFFSAGRITRIPLGRYVAIPRASSHLRCSR